MKCNHVIGYVYDEHDMHLLNTEMDENEEIYYDVEVRFNYCPDCGEKLRD